MNEEKSSSREMKLSDSCGETGVDIGPGNTCCTQPTREQVFLPSLSQPFVVGSIQTPVGAVPRVSSSLRWADRWGSIKARWGIGRMHYTVESSLYALGRPDDKSPVLVTANYKMSFDRLREALQSRDAWILVLATKGINVWCSAGKGTFGTEELVRKVDASGLNRVVSHRELILPQLAGPGVAAHLVQRLSGFKVVYGPIRAADLPPFLDAGLTATQVMRRKTFTMWERAVLIPVELVGALKWGIIIVPIVFLLGGLGSREEFWSGALEGGLSALLALLVALAAGAVLTPLFLPWLPGRAFFLKGLIVGLVGAGALVALNLWDLTLWAGRIEALAWALLIPATAAYLAMTFTGCSTYTSLSGVRREMRWAVPIEISMAGIGLCLWVGARFLA